jgi:hypothetical protein
MSFSATYTFHGNIRRDPFGRVVVDTCPSDGDHLRDSRAIPPDDRARCRTLVENVFQEHIDKRGKLLVTVSFEPEEDGPTT